MYLGHIVGQGSVAPRQAKVEVILNFSVPTNKRDLLRILRDLAGFYRKFCEYYSSIATPLTNLLRKNVKFHWSESCQEAFDNLKSILANEPVLMAPHFNKPFKIAVDARDLGSRAVLLQEDDSGVERPVPYFSRKLNIHQKNYSTIEKETFALVASLQHFEV